MLRNAYNKIFVLVENGLPVLHFCTLLLKCTFVEEADISKLQKSVSVCSTVSNKK